MTYRQLLEHLKTLTEEQLDQNVTVYVDHDNEFYEFHNTVTIADGSNVLDAGQPYLLLND